MLNLFNTLIFFLYYFGCHSFLRIKLLEPVITSRGDNEKETNILVLRIAATLTIETNGQN